MKYLIRTVNLLKNAVSTYKAGVSFLGRSGVVGSDRWERNAVTFTKTTLFFTQKL
jgi:hypothetical protein